METFNDMLFELHQDKTFCKSVVKVSPNVSIEWLDVRIVVSSANMSAVQLKYLITFDKSLLFTLIVDEDVYVPHCYLHIETFLFSNLHI